MLGILIPAVFLLTIGIFVLNSLAYLTPVYFLVILTGLLLFYFFANLDFEIVALFYKYYYVICLLVLFLPIILGSVTRGTIRWIPIAGLTIQPAELVRPFLLVFFAVSLTKGKKDIRHLLKSSLLFFIPTFLILIQPSLGVTMLTTIGFLGILLASQFPRKYYLYVLIAV